MESFKWGPHFITDIPEVDEQHYKLVQMLNRYGEALADNLLDRDFLDQIFKELADYAQVHFKSEETLMFARELDPRHIKDHINNHASFVTDISFMAEQVGEGDLKGYRQLLDFLIYWLAYHILGIDQVMARQIDMVNKGSKPEEAYEAEVLENNRSNEPLVDALSGLFSLISRRNRELVELNKTLESRVQERTRDLLDANRELEVISVTDFLTGLPNRRYALRQLKMHLYEAAQTGRSLACLMIDADGFKKVNDTYGHDAGDEVLKRLAKELQHSIRTDDIACRLGGDEFLVICPDTSLTGAMILGEQIREQVDRLHVAAGLGFWKGSISVGVSASVPGQENVDVLLKEADTAVYHAKKAGRNCVRSQNADKM